MFLEFIEYPFDSQLRICFLGYVSLNNIYTLLWLVILPPHASNIKISILCLSHKAGDNTHNIRYTGYGVYYPDSIFSVFLEPIYRKLFHHEIS